MNFDGKITCEPGRTIARDNLPLFYINIARNSRMANDYNLAPWQADSIARQIAAAMRAGIIRVPAELADGAALDANPPGAALIAAAKLMLVNATTAAEYADDADGKNRTKLLNCPNWPGVKALREALAAAGAP
jgi:hypothetical protein